jgi:hypothetical protein
VFSIFVRPDLLNKYNEKLALRNDPCSRCNKTIFCFDEDDFDQHHLRKMRKDILLWMWSYITLQHFQITCMTCTDIATSTRCDKSSCNDCSPIGYCDACKDSCDICNKEQCTDCILTAKCVSCKITTCADCRSIVNFIVIMNVLTTCPGCEKSSCQHCEGSFLQICVRCGKVDTTCEQCSDWERLQGQVKVCPGCLEENCHKKPCHGLR